MTVERLARAVLESKVELRPESVRRASARLRPSLAPLLDVTADDEVVARVLGLGPLEPLLADPRVSDVLVNGPNEVYVERDGHLERTDVTFADAASVMATIERAIAPLGLRLDQSAPVVDARLPDGSRLSAAVAPASVDGPLLAIRRFTDAVPDLDALVEAGAATTLQTRHLVDAVEARLNILVSGGTGSGKTTLLNLLSKHVDPAERVVVIEDAAELRLTGHVVRLEARPPNVDGTGAITLESLVRAALRLRPDRLIVGEVRGPEALDLISALNTGHAGSLATVHANSPAEALWRVETLAASGERRVPARIISRQLRRAVDLVVHLERRRGARRIVAIAKVNT